MDAGDFRLGKTFDVKFTTITSTGAPITLAGSPAVAAYADNNTTEITAGITLTVDFDSRTGLHNVRVVATGGNGYATGTNYVLVLTAGTVDGVSVVGYVVGHFSIEARSALMPTTADRTLVVDASGLADANTVKLGPTGSGTAQTARDIGASVLLSSGTGTGQLLLTLGVASANAVQISGDSTAADNLETAFDDTAGAVPWTGIIDQGTAQSATGTTVVLRAGAAFADDTLIGRGIEVFGSDQGYWQAREITDNVLSTDTVVVDAWTVTPTGTITYKIVGGTPSLSTLPTVNVTQISGDTQSATDLKDFVDTGYNPATHKVAGVVLVDTLTTYTSNTPQTGDSFARIGALGAGLTAVDDAVLTAIASLNNLSAAQVNAEVVDVLTVDTFSQPGQEAPAATTTLGKMIAYLYKILRNKKTQSATERKLYADDGTTVDQKATDSDDGTTYTKGELGSGP